MLWQQNGVVTLQLGHLSIDPTKKKKKKKRVNMSSFMKCYNFSYLSTDDRLKGNDKVFRFAPRPSLFEQGWCSYCIMEAYFKLGSLNNTLHILVLQHPCHFCSIYSGLTVFWHEDGTCTNTCLPEFNWDKFFLCFVHNTNMCQKSSGLRLTNVQLCYLRLLMGASLKCCSYYFTGHWTCKKATRPPQD